MPQRSSAGCGTTKRRYAPGDPRFSHPPQVADVSITFRRERLFARITA
jgi:hypothetical protein